MNYSKELEAAKKACVQAGNEILKLYKKNYKIASKSDKSKVTEADYLSQKIIIKHIKKFKHYIISEEKVDNPERFLHKTHWIVDPLDGTNDFIKETGNFSVVIGLIEKEKPVLGVIYKPITKELLYATKGNSAFIKKNGKINKLRVSQETKISNYKLTTSSHYGGKHAKAMIEKLQFKVIKKGSASVKFCEVATGNVELYLNADKIASEWDTCAGEAIVTEAGGKCTDLLGQPLKYNQKCVKRCGYVISNKKKHNHILKIISPLAKEFLDN